MQRFNIMGLYRASVDRCDLTQILAGGSVMPTAPDWENHAFDITTDSQNKLKINLTDKVPSTKLTID